MFHGQREGSHVCYACLVIAEIFVLTDPYVLQRDASLEYVCMVCSHVCYLGLHRISGYLG